MNLLLGVAALLLCACCANLASLLITRNAARGGEFAIRTAIGATPFRLVRQLLMESSLLAVAGGIAGLFLSRANVAVLDARFYAIDIEGRPQYFDFSLAPMVVVSVIAVTAPWYVSSPFFPAIQSARRRATKA